MHKCFKRRQRSQKPLFDREYELHFPHRRPLSQVQADCWTSENSDRCLRYVPRMKSGWRDKMKPGWQDEIYWNFSKNLQILCKNGKSIDHTRYLSIPILLSLGCRYRIWFSDTTTSISLCNRFCTKEKISNINIMIYFKTKREKYLYMEELWDYMRLVRGLGRASICLQMTPPTTNEKKSWSTSLST